jgi:hypothetical protein
MENLRSSVMQKTNIKNAIKEAKLITVDRLVFSRLLGHFEII